MLGITRGEVGRKATHVSPALQTASPSQCEQCTSHLYKGLQRRIELCCTFGTSLSHMGRAFSIGIMEINRLTHVIGESQQKLKVCAQCQFSFFFLHRWTHTLAILCSASTFPHHLKVLPLTMICFECYSLSRSPVCFFFPYSVNHFWFNWKLVYDFLLLQFFFTSESSKIMLINKITYLNQN